MTTLNLAYNNALLADGSYSLLRDKNGVLAEG